MGVLRTRTPSRLSSFLYEHIVVVIIINNASYYFYLNLNIHQFNSKSLCIISKTLLLLLLLPLPLPSSVFTRTDTAISTTTIITITTIVRSVTGVINVFHDGPRLSATLQVPGRMFVHHLSATRWHCFLASFQTLRCPTLTFKTYVFIA